MDEPMTHTKNVKILLFNHDVEPTGPKVLSRYLRGSPRSCHDNCKSGTKHSTETKPRNLFSKRVLTTPANLAQKFKKDDDLNPNLNPKSNSKSTPNSNSKSTPKSKPSLTKAYSLPALTVPKTQPIESIIDSSLIGGLGSDKKKNILRKNSKLSLVSGISSPRLLGNGKNPKKATSFRILKSFPKSKLQDLRKSNPTKPIDEIPKNTLSVVEVNHVDESIKSQSQTSLVSLSFDEKNWKCSENGSPKIQENTLCVIEVNHDDESIKSQSQSQTSPVSSSSNEQISKCSENGSPKFQENTLYVVEVNHSDKATKSQSQTSLVFLSSDKKSLKCNENGSPIASPPTSPGSQTSLESGTRSKNTKKTRNKDSGPKKLKFKQGTVINGETDSNNSRKLEFQQGKVLDEEQKAETHKRNLRRMSSDSGSYTPKPHSVKVVLKHQDKREKKDSVHLFNNVIKETASKLIKTRKSKVKALVGAFEKITRTDNELVDD